MLGDLELAYLGVDAPDTAAFGKFLANVVGLVPGDDPDTWRNDRKARRVIVTDGPSAGATFLGFEAAGPDVWTATVNQLESAGSGGRELCHELRLLLALVVQKLTELRPELAGEQANSRSHLLRLLPVGHRAVDDVECGCAILAPSEQVRPGDR